MTILSTEHATIVVENVLYINPYHGHFMSNWFDCDYFHCLHIFRFMFTLQMTFKSTAPTEVSCLRSAPNTFLPLTISPMNGLNLTNRQNKIAKINAIHKRQAISWHPSCFCFLIPLSTPCFYDLINPENWLLSLLCEY